MTDIQVAVEGDLDFAVAGKLLAGIGAVAVLAAPPRGKDALKDKIHGYNADAARVPWFVLCDLDRGNCAPALVADWLSGPNLNMCFRVAVRSIEAWLLADQALAPFLHVSVARLPQNPEQEFRPKLTTRNLARRSRLRDIREGMGGLPDREFGPEYTMKLTEFVRDHWDPARAAERSDSLRRAVSAIERLAAR